MFLSWTELLFPFFHISPSISLTGNVREIRYFSLKNIETHINHRNKFHPFHLTTYIPYMSLHTQYICRFMYVTYTYTIHKYLYIFHFFHSFYITLVWPLLEQQFCISNSPKGIPFCSAFCGVKMWSILISTIPRSAFQQPTSPFSTKSHIFNRNAPGRCFPLPSFSFNVCLALLSSLALDIGVGSILSSSSPSEQELC